MRDHVGRPLLSIIRCVLVFGYSISARTVRRWLIQHRSVVTVVCDSLTCSSPSDKLTSSRHSGARAIGFGVFD